MSIGFSEQLERHPDFRMLNAAECNEIAQLATSLSFHPSEILRESNSLTNGFYYVLSGNLELSSTSVEGHRLVIDTLHEGAIEDCNIFDADEHSAYNLQVGAEQSIIQFLSKEVLNQFLENNPALGDKLRNGQRLKEILNFLIKAESLDGIPREGLINIAEYVTEETVAAGTIVIKQGDKEDSLFFVKNGKFVVSRDEAPSVRIATQGSGSILGEMAVLTGEPRSANITAEDDAIIYRVPGEAFRKIVEEHTELSNKLKMSMSQRLQESEDAAQETKTKEIKTTEENTSNNVTDVSSRRRKAEAETISASRGWLARRIKPPALRQHSQMDCSAACLSTVCKYYGKDVSINTTREIARVRQEGASMANVIRALGEIGFKTEAFVSSIDQLKEKKLPAIANWKGYHWIVVYEVTDTHVICADPAEGLVKHTLEDFIGGWSRYTIFMEPTTKFEQFPESKSSILALWSFYQPHKKTILELFLLAIFMQILSIASPLFSKFVIDDIIMKGDQQWLMTAIYIMGVITILTMLMDYISDIMALRLSLRCNFNMISHVYNRLLKLPLSYFEARKVGDITNRLEQHEEVTDFVTEDGLNTFIDLMKALAFSILMFTMDVWLSILAIGFMSQNYFVVRFISPRLRQLERESFVKEADQESHTIESLQAAGTLKRLGAQHQSRWKYENNFAAVTNLNFKQAKFSQAADIFTTMLDSLGDAAILFLGGYFVLIGKMSIGELVAFQAFANGVQEPINALVGKWDEIQEVRIAVERMNDILEKDPEYLDDEDPREKQKIELPRLTGRIDFSDLTFRYEPDDPMNVIQGLNLNIERGQKVAFVGTSGCGKSTLIKLLYGFYPASSGQIIIDGFNQHDVTLTSLRKQIAMVPQSSLMMRSSVRENIAIARPNASLEDIMEAAQLAQAHDFIMKMPGGYSSMIEEGAANISGGQRQRLCLARAFLQQAPILVLDEATSALDVETERVIMGNVDTHFDNCTVLMIAHRLSTVRQADKIVVLNRGMIAEQGTHSELMGI